MEWHVNDLSMCGQFHDGKSLMLALEPILKARIIRPELKNRVFISRSLYLRHASPTETLLKVVSTIENKNMRELAMRWFANGGPFWDDDRFRNEDDLFHLDTVDVTEQGLGEAARRRLCAVPAGVFSFGGAGQSLSVTPLQVIHGLPDEPLGELSIENVLRVEDLYGDVGYRLESWADLLSHAKGHFTFLLISDEIAKQLAPCPFHSGVGSRIIELLQILDSLGSCFATDGSLNDKGKEIIQKHFVGEKAQFTDESDRNKKAFKSEMTFPDPENVDTKIFCPWHGKVKIGQFRIHFQWRKPLHQRMLKVLYIGPKITKW